MGVLVWGLLVVVEMVVLLGMEVNRLNESGGGSRAFRGVSRVVLVGLLVVAELVVVLGAVALEIKEGARSVHFATAI